MKWALKLKASDVYKSKSHMNYYNFIAKCENYFAISKAKSCN